MTSGARSFCSRGAPAAPRSAPTLPRGFDRTSESTTASRSPPWKPSTERISSVGISGLSSARSASTWPLYGVMSAISSGRSPASRTSARTCAAATAASPAFACGARPRRRAAPRAAARAAARRGVLVVLAQLAARGVEQQQRRGRHVGRARADVRQARERAAGDARRGDEPAAVHRGRRPRADVVVHAVLHREHARDWTVAARGEQPVEERRREPAARGRVPCTVGASCRWSPASTARRPRSSGSQHDASSACAASSITTRTNGRWRAVAADAAAAGAARAEDELVERPRRRADARRTSTTSRDASSRAVTARSRRAISLRINCPSSARARARRRRRRGRRAWPRA